MGHIRVDQFLETIGEAMLQVTRGMVWEFFVTLEPAVSLLVSYGTAISGVDSS